MCAREFDPNTTNLDSQGSNSKPVAKELSKFCFNNVNEPIVVLAQTLYICWKTLNK